MNTKPRIFVALTIVCTLCFLLLWIHTFDKERNAGDLGSSTAGERLLVTSTSDSTLPATRPELVSEEEAARLSPPEWTPPAAFSALAKPALRKHYQRGEHGSRYYEGAVSKQVKPSPEDRKPVILAKTPEDGRMHLLPEEIDSHTLIARRMVFDPTALERVMNGEASKVLAPSTGQEVLTLAINSYKSRGSQTHTLMGRVEGEETTSDVQLVYHDGVIHGTVARYETGQHLEYRILADGHMMVRELDTSSMVEVCGNKTEAEDAGEHEHHEGCLHPLDDEQSPQELTGEKVDMAASVAGDEIAQDTLGWTTVDMVVGYEKQTRSADFGYSQIEARIIASIDRMNTAFANSQIYQTEVNLLGTIEDPVYDWPGRISGSQYDEIDDLSNPSDGRLDAVSNYATQLGADLVAFIPTLGDGSAGVATRGGRFSVTARTGMNSARMTFCHEVGHDLGCEHSWGDSSQAYHSSYGWRIDPTNTQPVRTIMSYDDEWGDPIPYFANPNVRFNGVATGANYRFNVKNESRADQRYYRNGYAFNNGVYGFTGSNGSLAAYNADTIYRGTGSSRFGAAYASSRRTRVSNAVINPVASSTWDIMSEARVSFVGGDHSDTAVVELYKGGVYQATISGGLDPATDRNLNWIVFGNLVSGSDYKVRVTLHHEGGGSRSFESANFRINGLPANTVRLIDPNGGETYARGQACEITWLTSLTGRVIIELIQDGQSPVYLANLASRSSRYVWVVPPSLAVGGHYRFRVSSASNPAYADSSDASFSIVDQQLTLDEALDTQGIAWNASGDKGWFRQTAVSHDGHDAAQSGAIGDEQSSSLEMTLTGPGTLTFWWKVDSLVYEDLLFDGLGFLINGVLQSDTVPPIGGNVNWKQETVTIPAGINTVRWTYSKDDSFYIGRDCGWVDQVVFVPDVTSYGSWAGGNFSMPFNSSSLSGDPDGDRLTNAQEFAFGLDPTSPLATTLRYNPGGGPITTGLPLLIQAEGGHQAVFTRRKDHVATGLDYDVEFSADLTRWTSSLSGLQLLNGGENSSDYEVVGVPFPATVPLEAGSTVAPQFFRVETTMKPMTE